MTVTRSCFSLRPAEAGLRPFFKEVAGGHGLNRAARVCRKSGLRPGRQRTGHGSRFTAEVVRLVTSPSASSPSPTLGDELNRLTTSTNTGAPANNQTWVYDSLGRITNNSRIGNYTYGSSRPHAVTAAGSNTYTSYDNNGNLLLGGGRTLTWDANNMVTQVVMGGNTTTFTYGPDGDRIKKASSSTTLRYPFGDDYEINGSTVTKYFNAGFGVIAKKVATTLYWLHTDRMGSINATTDGSGAEVLRRSYRSYGELLGQTGTDTGESLGYIGQRTDSETGLTYLHARYYDSALGMFVSPDPAEADRNTYRYADGNPTNRLDPSGLAGHDSEGRGGSDEICERFGWSCTAQQAGGGYGGMGGPGPGSSASSQSALGGLSPVLVAADGFIYPDVTGTYHVAIEVPRPGVQVAGGSDDTQRDIAKTLTDGVDVAPAGPVAVGGYTIPQNTMLSVRIEGGGSFTLILSNPATRTGVFGGSLSQVTFNRVGTATDNDATWNWGPDFLAQWKVSSSASLAAKRFLLKARGND